MVRLLRLVVVLPALLVSCSRPDDGDRPRLVVLYAPCTVRCDYLAPYDPDVTWTPHLAAFGRGATVFERHQTEAGASGIAYASILSGLQAPQHGVFTHPRELADSVDLVTEVFAAAGYDVYAWLAHPMANGALNYAQGVRPDQVFTTALEAGDPSFTRILDRLDEDPGYRALIVTDFWTSHRPYPAPRLDEFCRDYPDQCPVGRERFDYLRGIFTANHVSFAYDFDRTVERLDLQTEDVGALAATVETLYKAGINRLDALFGGVVDAIESRGLMDESVIVFTADHGEVLYREDLPLKWCHTFQLAPEVLRVPLLVRGAGVGAGRYGGVTRSVDLLPTLAGLCGITFSGYEGPGVDLTGALAGDEPEPDLVALSHTLVMPEMVAAQLDELDTLRALVPGADPEFMGVSLVRGDVACMLLPGLAEAPDDAACAAELEAYRSVLLEAYDLWRSRPGELNDDDLRRILRSLGYMR